MHRHVCYRLLVSLFSLNLSVLSISAPVVIYVECSQLYFSSNTPYQSNLNSLFSSIVESASIGNFNTFKISAPDDSPNDTVYGLFQCQGDLSFSDCRDCVASSVSPLKTTCPVSIGGTIQSEGCLLKYDGISFFGLEDKREVLKRCGPSIGYNSDVLNSRDDALACLNDLNGQYFRIGGSGSVQSMAQCIQDLSVSDCQECLAEASGRLRSECVTSSWGDMYLGKCYIRYADHGVDNGNRNDNNNTTTENHSDSAESNNSILKAVGIIVAAMIGTVGLSYCFSVSITKNILKISATNTNQNTNTINFHKEKEEFKEEAKKEKEELKKEIKEEARKEKEEAKKEIKEVSKKRAKKLDEKHDYIVKDIDARSSMAGRIPRY